MSARKPAQGTPLRTAWALAVMVCGITVACSHAKPVGRADTVVAGSSTPTDEELAERAATGWLALADRGDYSACYDASAVYVRNKIDRATIVKALGEGHAETGPVRSRVLDGATPEARVEGLPEGQYVSLVFTARYAHWDDAAIEKVTVTRDADGQWRVVAFNTERPRCTALPDAPTKLTAPPATLGLDPFYEKYANADGIPVVASRHVSDRAINVAAMIVRRMLRKRPDIRDRLVAAGSRVAVMSPVEQTLDLPEQRDLADTPTDTLGVDWNERARGLGGTFGEPLASCGEENLLCKSCDRYRGGSTLIHEFGHTMEVVGLGRDAAFQRDLVAAYEGALAKGLWKGTYSATDKHEYWAVGVQSWFDANVPWERRSRSELAAYDPGLSALLARVFLDDDWRYRCGAEEDSPATGVPDASAVGAVGPAPKIHPPHACPRGTVSVPGGLFPMGAEEVVQPFCMDATEVTVAAYAACVRSGRCTPAATTVHVPGVPEDKQATWNAFCNGNRPDRQKHPVNCVDWNQATTYCKAKGERLPTEQEWEWAARGGSRALRYPWGSDAPGSQLCWSGAGQKREGTCEVGTFPAGDTAEGIHDLAGGVWEWTSSTFDGETRVGKGGGWDATLVSFVRPTNRDEGDPAFRAHNTGFRCAE